jgi:hypothetical protein
MKSLIKPTLALLLAAGVYGCTSQEGTPDATEQTSQVQEPIASDCAQAQPEVLMVLEGSWRFTTQPTNTMCGSGGSCRTDWSKWKNVRRYLRGAGDAATDRGMEFGALVFPEMG